MPVFIALYRGINVGGKNPVSMHSLRAMHVRLAHRGTRSYIQSGNIVFSADGSADAVARKLSAEFARTFGFPAKLMVVEARRWGQFVQGNPFAKFAAGNPKLVHAGICDGEPDEKALTALLAKTGGAEAFRIGKGIVYLHAPDGFGTSKFAAGMERAAGVPMTVRNWRTMAALWEMAKSFVY
jgi:uncharacterized protein (DUF1697 family)